MNPEPFNDLSWNDDPLHSPNRTIYIEKLRARVKELESACVMKITTLDNLVCTHHNDAERQDVFNRCPVCTLVKVQVLEGELAIAQSLLSMARIIKDADADKLTAPEREVSRLSEYLEHHQQEIAMLTKERDQLKGELVAMVDAVKPLPDQLKVWLSGSTELERIKSAIAQAGLLLNPTPHDATERQKE